MFKFGQSQNVPPKNTHETLDVAVVAPPVESLLSPDSQNSLWPEEIKNNPELKAQATLRRELSTRLDTLYKTLPNATTNIQEGIESGTLDTKEVTKIYEEFSNLLESDENAKRLLLYFPFELLPQGDWKSTSEELTEVTQHFSAVYMEKWRTLLDTHDFRANFVDGDIPESELRNTPLPKVSKAAHLIPILVQKKLLTVEETFAIMEKSSDKVLRESIADTIPVLADMQLLSGEQIDTMARSSDALLCNMAIIVRDNLQNKTQKNQPETKLRDKVWLENVGDKIQNDLATTDADFKTLPPARAAWKKEQHEKNSIEKYSREIAAALLAQSITPTDIENYIDAAADGNLTLVGIQSIRKTIEQIATTDKERAKQEQLVYKPLLAKLWKNNTPKIHDALESMWSRWISLGVIDQSYLQEFGVTLSKLDALFSTEQKGLKVELQELSKITKSIETNEELSKFVYPASIMYGSKIKGYGTRDADIDVAVFVRPETKIEDRTHIEKLLSETFKHDKIKGKVLQFWLEKNGDTLRIQDLISPDKSLGNSAQTYVLFEGAWCGENKTIKELYEKVLTSYLHSKGQKVIGKDAQEIWLGEMERDILQYRLLHKGYARFYPEQGGIATEHSDCIDSESVFWDSGYRRLATKLFLAKVFLPQLDKPKA